MFGLFDALLLPLVSDVVDARLDALEVARREDALQPLDVEGVVVLQARLLLDDGKLFHLGPSKTKSLNAEMYVNEIKLLKYFGYMSSIKNSVKEI
jgi:hypothetical protein